MSDATQPQLDYISMLAIDCNFTLAQRRDFLRRETGRQNIESISDLTKAEASACIQKLIELKESNWK